MSKDFKNEQEVINTLQEAGIQVIMKPIALIQTFHTDREKVGEIHNVGLIETNIYDALSMLETRKKLKRDPFKE